MPKAGRLLLFGEDHELFVICPTQLLGHPDPKLLNNAMSDKQRHQMESLQRTSSLLLACVHMLPSALLVKGSGDIQSLRLPTLVALGSLRQVVPNLGPPDVLVLQLLEVFTSTSTGQDFWELKSKNIWRPKVGDHCHRGFF